MKVRYRIVQEITPEGEWETIGVMVHWESDPPHLQLRGLVQHTVSRPIWRSILEQVKARHLTLESYDQALGEYAHYYRLLPKIYEFEGDSVDEIRRTLRERFVYGQQTEPVTA